MPPVLKKSVFSLAAIALALLLAEGGLRLAGFRPKSAPFIVFVANPERSLAEKGENYDFRKNVVYETDSAAFWKLKPGGKVEMCGLFGSYDINSMGFRGREFPESKAEGGYRIIVLGDSIVFGLGVPEEKIFCSLLEGKLCKSFAPMKVEVISAGVPGYTSYQGRQLLKRELLDLRPDLLIVYFGGNNEFAMGFHTDREYAALIQVQFLEKCLRRSALLGLMDSAAGRIRGRKLNASGGIRTVPDRPRVPLGDFLDDLLEIERLAKKAGSSVILVAPPHSKINLEKQPDAEFYSRLIRALGKSVQVADVDAVFKNRDSGRLFLWDHIHPNEAGHAVIADILCGTAEKEIAGRLKTGSARKAPP